MFDDTLNTEQNCQSVALRVISQLVYQPVHGPGQTVGEVNVPHTLLLVGGKYYLGCFGHLCGTNANILSPKS